MKDNELYASIAAFITVAFCFMVGYALSRKRFADGIQPVEPFCTDSGPSCSRGRITPGSRQGPASVYCC